MPINENWNIRGRAHACSLSGKPFEEGEVFYTALFEEGPDRELVRRDYSAESWKTVSREAKPFSVWRSRYEPPPPPEERPEVVEKQTAETLLRRLVEENAPGTENVRYILAIMLERRKRLKQTAVRETPEDTFLVYEHVKTGDVYVIRDPELKLDQISEVQREVALLLETRAETAFNGGS